MPGPYARRRALWVHPRVAVPERGGAERRLRGLVDAAIGDGWEVLVALPEGNLGAPAGWALRELRLRRGLSRAWAKVFSRRPLRSPRAIRHDLRRCRSEVAAFDPDVVVVSDLLAWSLAEHLVPDGSLVVYDAHNVETDLYRGFARSARGVLDRTTFREDARRVAHDERFLLRRAHLVLAVSDADAARLHQLAPGTPTRVVPSSVAPAPATPVLSSGPTALFVGTLDFPPNTAAVTELVSDIWPQVVAGVPSARLVVAGRRPTAALRDVLASPYVEFVEAPDDLEPLYAAARCVVLPIRSGSGTKLKVFEALAHGVPVVATTGAVAGIDIDPGVEFVLAEAREDLVRETVDLLRDHEHAGAVGTRGRSAFEERLSWERAGGPALVAALRDLAPSVEAEGER